MKFCRSCGSSLGGGGGNFAVAPTAPPANAGFGAPLGMPPPGPMGGMPPGGPMGGPPPLQGGFAMPPPPTAPPPMAPIPPPQPFGGMAPGAAPTVACPRCGTQTPTGFQFCQQCGLHMGALQPTDPGAAGIAAPRTHTPSGISGQPPLGGQPMIDPQGATLAVDPRSAPPPPGMGAPLGAMSNQGSAPVQVPMAQTGPAWGQAVLVNRDGSDGQRFPLAGESVVIGRGGADIAFDDDRFLAREHARIERDPQSGGVAITAIDTLNGVFRKTGEPTDLVDGAVVLVGREVLRFELVAPEERSVHPLVRHGVALFGSPPREPWGRLLQLIPSGGFRDVRHLFADEIVLGREEGDCVYRDDQFMSRRHAAVTWNGQRAQITDLGSSNGTFIRVAAVALKHGDHVRLGDQLMRIELGR